MNFRNYATFEIRGFFGDIKFFSLHARFLTKSKLGQQEGQRSARNLADHLQACCRLALPKASNLFAGKKPALTAEPMTKACPPADNFTEIGFPSFKHKTLLTGFNDTSTTAKDHTPKSYMETRLTHLTCTRTYSGH